MTFNSVLVAATLAVLPIELGCAAAPPGRHVVVFLDRSCSVNDDMLAGYRADWERVVVDLQPGDRITMGPITSDTYATFRPVVDERLPRFRPLVDNRLRFDARSRAAQRARRCPAPSQCSPSATSARAPR